MVIKTDQNPVWERKNCSLDRLKVLGGLMMSIDSQLLNRDHRIAENALGASLP